MSYSTTTAGYWDRQDARRALMGEDDATKPLNSWLQVTHRRMCERAGELHELHRELQRDPDNGHDFALREVAAVVQGNDAEAIHSRLSDWAICKLAERRAELMERECWAVDTLTPLRLAQWLNDRVTQLNARPFQWKGQQRGEAPDPDTLAGMLARMKCRLWWRRQLRRAVVQLRETEAIHAHEICVTRGQPYCTHDTVRRRIERQQANAALLAATEIENEAGEVLTLAEAAAKSVSNPAIRRGELMTRIRGCEEIAQAAGHAGVFCALTTPSRFHSTKKHGEANPKWEAEALTPRDAQQWLCEQWARLRTHARRLGLRMYGLRVAEPHHDSTTHWHAMLWHPERCEQTRTKALRKAFRKAKGLRAWQLPDFCGPLPRLPEGRRQWVRVSDWEGAASPFCADAGATLRHLLHEHFLFSDSPDEPGARERRVSVKTMEPGGAAGYCAKYIAKGIDDAGAVGTEGHRDDDPETGEAFSVEAQGDLFGGKAKTIEAWAAAHGIRQFQMIGQPPVTVWRELRRIKPEALAGSTERVRQAHAAAHRDGEKRADWAGYVKAQGGVMLGRCYLVRLAQREEEREGRYGTTARKFPKGVEDVQRPGEWVLSDRREWKPRGTWNREPVRVLAPLPGRYVIEGGQLRENPAYAAALQLRQWEEGAARSARPSSEGERPKAVCPPRTRFNNCTQIAGLDLPKGAPLKTWRQVIEEQESVWRAAQMTPEGLERRDG